MKSYLEHLKSTNVKVNPISIFRSSAIFPIICNKSIDCKIHFLSYWFIKKKIKEIQCKYTIRNQKGEIIVTKNFLINSTKSYEISCKKVLNFKFIKFIGSIEIEFFSSHNLLYPYPAVIINYDTVINNSYVHTCGRIYNNLQDKLANTIKLVPESGFDIIPNKNYTPFFAFVNGKEKIVNQKIKIKLINCFGDVLIKKIQLSNINEYQTEFIFFLDKNEKKFFKNKKGTVVITHNFKSFYPRFLCGNFKNNLSAVMLTHSYYDLNDKFWLNPNKEIFYDSITTFPYFAKDKLNNEITIYPNFIKKKNFCLRTQLLDSEGNIVFEKDLLFLDKNLKKVMHINYNKILKDVIFDENLTYFIKLIIVSKEGVPTRFKIGYNLSSSNKNTHPTNICFNSYPPSLAFVSKVGTFRWCPLIDYQNSIICLSNINYLKKDFKDANIIMRIWGPESNKFIKRKIFIKNNGNIFLNFKKDEKIKKLIKNKNGWITFESDNPFLNGFYFTISPKGYIGGDHIF